MATFLDAIATVDILTVSNDVKLVETFRALTNSTSITRICKFYHLFASEIPRDIVLSHQS